MHLLAVDYATIDSYCKELPYFLFSVLHNTHNVHNTHKMSLLSRMKTKNQQAFRHDFSMIQGKSVGPESQLGTFFKVPGWPSGPLLMNVTSTVL